MGRLVATSVHQAVDLELAGLFDPAGAGEGLAGLTISDEAAVLTDCEVVVEFTNPDVVMSNLARWRAQGSHAVVGTSGFSRERLAEVAGVWGEGPPNCVIAPNYSIGAVLMMRFAELAAPHFAAAEVVELHHDQKADAPSGTATSTAERIARAKPDQQRAVDSAELVEGARGASVGGVPVHAVRLPGLVAHQEVLLGNQGEWLTIRHDTTDRSAFMAGVLLAVRNVAGLPGVTVGIEGLLGL
jgi:4-hydroxy-tetrahydrodipicolinate reductase